MSEKGRTLEQSPLGSENSRLAVKSYFQRTSVYLKERIQPMCLGVCQRGNQKVLGLCQHAHPENSGNKEERR